jgi:glycerate dehydrogenase
MLIKILDSITLGDDIDLSTLKNLGKLEIYSTTPPALTLERIAGADCIITNKVEITKFHLENTPSLKLICVAATGMNNIDLVAAQSLGIVVKNVSGYSTEGVAQHTMAMLLYGAQHLGYYAPYTRENYFSSPFFSHHGKTISLLKGKKLGILGLGTIGLEVARLALAFGLSIHYHSVSGKNLNQPFPHLDWHSFLEESDIISIHAPLNQQTKHLFNEEAFSRIKPECMLINTGRGGIIDENALYKALSTNKLKFAALDVFEKEPIDSNHILLGIANDRLLLTPHIAWAAFESRKKLLEGIIENIRSVSW